MLSDVDDRNSFFNDLESTSTSWDILRLSRIPDLAITDTDKVSDLFRTIVGVEVVEVSGVAVGGEVVLSDRGELNISAIFEMNPDSVVVLLPGSQHGCLCVEEDGIPAPNEVSLEIVDGKTGSFVDLVSTATGREGAYEVSQAEMERDEAHLHHATPSRHFDAWPRGHRRGSDR